MSKKQFRRLHVRGRIWQLGTIAETQASLLWGYWRNQNWSTPPTFTNPTIPLHCNMLGSASHWIHWCCYDAGKYRAHILAHVTCMTSCPVTMMPSSLIYVFSRVRCDVHFVNYGVINQSHCKTLTCGIIMKSNFKEPYTVLLIKPFSRPGIRRTCQIYRFPYICSNSRKRFKLWVDISYVFNSIFLWESCWEWPVSVEVE